MEVDQEQKRQSYPRRTQANYAPLPSNQIDSDKEGEEEEMSSASDNRSELNSDEDDEGRSRGKKAGGGGAKKKTKRSRFRGVYFNISSRAKPWVASISIHHHNKYLGSYATEEEAAEVFRQAARERDKDKKKKSSKYAGVTVDKRAVTKPWMTQIQVHGKKKHLGCFATEEEAAHAYAKAARPYQKDRATLNFPDSPAASGGGGRVEGETQDTDESSDDEEEEMDEDESMSSVMSSDGEEEKDKTLMRSKARAMVGPAVQAIPISSSSSGYHQLNKDDDSDDSDVVVVGKATQQATVLSPFLPSSKRHAPTTAAREDKGEDKGMKPSAVPVKEVSMNKTSKREEDEFGGGNGDRRQKKLRAEERLKNHNGQGDLQDSHKEEKKAKGDGGGGMLLLPSASSSSSGRSTAKPRQLSSTAAEPSTSTTVTSCTTGEGRAAMRSKATAIVSPEVQAPAISSTASSHGQQPSTSHSMQNTYHIETDDDSDDSSVVVIAPQTKSASSSKSEPTTITQDDNHVKPSAKRSKGSDKANEESDARSEKKVRCEERPRDQHDREEPNGDAKERTSSHGSSSSSSSDGGGIASSSVGGQTGVGLLPVPSSIPPSSAGPPVNGKPSQLPTAAVQLTAASEASGAPSVDELRKRAIGILSAELKDAMMAGDTPGQTQRLRKAITSIVKGAMDQLLEGMFVAGPMRIEEEVSREALVGLLLDLAW